MNNLALQTNIKLLIPNSDPEEDGYAGILIAFSQEQAREFSQTIRASSYLMVNSEHFKPNGKTIHCKFPVLDRHRPFL